GRIVLVPFSYPYDSLIARLWDWIVDIVLHIPIGAVAALGWTPDGRPRRPSIAVAYGVAFAAVIELCQVFVFTRYADATDVVTGSVGVALGVAVAMRYLRGNEPANRSDSGQPIWPLFATAAWTIVLLAYHWFPFDFVVAKT